MFRLSCLQVSHPLRWVPSCLEVWATATGTLFTFTTTTRWVSLLFTICSSDCLDSYSHVLHSVSLVVLLWTLHFTCEFLTCLELFIIMVSESSEHFELSQRFCLWINEGVCLSPCNSCVLTAHLLYFTSSSFILLSQLHAMWVWMCVRGHIHLLCFFFPLFPPSVCQF